MKKIAFFGLLAMVLAFGLIGCGGDDNKPEIKEYPFDGDGEAYVLKINVDDGTYELTVDGKTSKGTATKNGDTWTLTPTGKEPFYVTIGSSGITGMEGTITFPDNSTKVTPDNITMTNTPPSGNTNPFKGTWTGTMQFEDGDSYIITFILGDTSFESTSEAAPGNSGVDIVATKGTYTYTSTGITTTVTEVKYGSENDWVSEGEMLEWYGGTQTYLLSNGKLIVEVLDGSDIVLTKS